jgi:murein DD-endopeptidase MepM/ murein hydrolase activator NlpD
MPAAQFHLAGAAYDMLPDRTAGVWYAYVGLGTSFGIGSYPVSVYSGQKLMAQGQLDVGAGGFDYTQITIPPGPAGLLQDTARIEAERQQVAAIESVFTNTRYWSGPWITPTQGNITSNFGEHRSVNGGAYFAHTGLDIANAEGTPVYAAATGKVAMAQQLYLYGNSIIIDHGTGVFTDYSHLSSMTVKAGQMVNRGDLIGYMGTTGFSSGPHLHWEAIIRNVRVDPRHFTAPGFDP